ERLPPTGQNQTLGPYQILQFLETVHPESQDADPHSSNHIASIFRHNAATDVGSPSAGIQRGHIRSSCHLGRRIFSTRKRLSRGSPQCFFSILIHSALCRLRRDRQSLQGQSEASKTEGSREEDVPGISRILGEPCRSHARATCMGGALSDDAAASSADDCSGEKPPS